MDSDYGLVRQQLICPLCHNEKADGLLVCWPCYRAHNLRNGISPVIVHILASVEERLLATVQS